jgi:hypothetical protein
MLFHSRIPPKHLWPESERNLWHEGVCAHGELPLRLFCGKPAVSLTEEGPRCGEHLKVS